MSAGYPVISHMTSHQSNTDNLDVSSGQDVAKSAVLSQSFVLPVSLASNTPMLASDDSLVQVPASINLPLHALLQLSSDASLASLLKDQGAGKASGVTLQLPTDALKAFTSQALLPSNNDKRPSGPTLEDLAAVLAAQTKEGQLMINPAQSEVQTSTSAAVLTSRILQSLAGDTSGDGDSLQPLLTAAVTYASQGDDAHHDGQDVHQDSQDRGRQLHDNFSESMTTLQMEALLNVTNMGTPSSSTFDLFDGDSSMADFNVEGNTDLHLSPQAFLNDPSADHDSSSGKFHILGRNSIIIML